MGYAEITAKSVTLLYPSKFKGINALRFIPFLFLIMKPNITCRYCGEKFFSYIDSYAHICPKNFNKKLWSNSKIHNRHLMRNNRLIQ